MFTRREILALAAITLGALVAQSSLVHEPPETPPWVTAAASQSDAYRSGPRANAAPREEDQNALPGARRRVSLSVETTQINDEAFWRGNERRQKKKPGARSARAIPPRPVYTQLGYMT